jgi:hypothetical protein
MAEFEERYGGGNTMGPTGPIVRLIEMHRQIKTVDRFRLYFLVPLETL